MMNLEIVNKDQFVFYSGDEGDKFYIILKGEVAVRIRVNGEII